jgi:hypothetical protein
MERLSNQGEEDAAAVLGGQTTLAVRTVLPWLSCSSSWLAVRDAASCVMRPASL